MNIDNLDVLNDDFNQHLHNFVSSINDSEDIYTLENIYSQYTGKKSYLKSIQSKIFSIKDHDYKMKVINVCNKFIIDVKIEYEKKVDRILSERGDNEILSSTYKYYDTDTDSNSHPIYSFIYEIIKKFKDKYGYYVIHCNEVDTSKNNFNKLNIPLHHPSRAESDTFYIDDEYLLRTHSSNAQQKIFQHVKDTNNIYNYYLSVGRVFRNDDIDSSHTQYFHQCEFVEIGDNVSIFNLLNSLNLIIGELLGNDIKFRIRRSYFPFTEPSFEIDIKFNTSSKWIEVLGAGMISKKVMNFNGMNSDKFMGYAIGLGIERILMIKYKLNDIRQLHTLDINKLSYINHSIK